MLTAMSQTVSAHGFGSRFLRAVGRPLSRVRLGFEVVSVVSLIAAGVWFVVAGWGEFSNVAAITAFVVVGFTSGVLVLPLSVSARHWPAVGAAVVSVVTPTGFAYLPNLLMVAVAVIEVRLAIAARVVSEQATT